tara:strand:+ start:461 stop:691 length:231 start_codon:yes stop_codon:yes gene_type:complete
MNYEIKIEATIKPKQLASINEIIKLAQGLIDLDALWSWMGCCNIIEENLISGYTGSHIWISDKETGKRILLITEKK